MGGIDPTPSTVATTALQGIPFSAIIGGPLQAAIDAQAMAAQSTYNFITDVGFTPGTNTIQNVVFTYQQGAQMMNLSVPLLAIVPIPAIVVTNITIDFTAQLNAASSSVASQNASSSTSASGSVGYSGWGLTANFNASYTSSSSASSSQSSKYSIQYTLTVHVEAQQADLPPGLQTILNILSNAAQSSNPNGSFLVQVPASTPVSGTATVTGVLTDANGLGVSGATVTATQPSGAAYSATAAPTGGATTDTNGNFTFAITTTQTTSGTAPFTLAVTGNVGPANATGQMNVPFVAS